MGPSITVLGPGEKDLFVSLAVVATSGKGRGGKGEKGRSLNLSPRK